MRPEPGECWRRDWSTPARATTRSRICPCTSGCRRQGQWTSRSHGRRLAGAGLQGKPVFAWTAGTPSRFESAELRSTVFRVALSHGASMETESAISLERADQLADQRALIERA